MTLKEAIDKIAEYDRDQTIFVANYSADADTVIDFENDDGTFPESASSLLYLLEVSLALDVIRVWSQWRNNQEPTLDQKVEAVLHYARHDTFIPKGHE